MTRMEFRMGLFVVALAGASAYLAYEGSQGQAAQVATLAARLEQACVENSAGAFGRVDAVDRKGMADVAFASGVREVYHPDRLKVIACPATVSQADSAN